MLPGTVALCNLSTRETEEEDPVFLHGEFQGQPNLEKLLSQRAGEVKGKAKQGKVSVNVPRNYDLIARFFFPFLNLCWVCCVHNCRQVKEVKGQIQELFFWCHLWGLFCSVDTRFFS